MKKKTKLAHAVAHASPKTCSGHVLWPTHVTVNMFPVPGKPALYHLDYTEKLPLPKNKPDRERVIRNTVALVESLGFSPTVTEDGDLAVFSISHDAPHHEIGAMLAGEFFGWSSFGSKSIRELLGPAGDKSIVELLAFGMAKARGLLS